MDVKCILNADEVLGLLTKAGELVALEETLGFKVFVAVQAAHNKPMPPNLKLVA